MARINVEIPEPLQPLADGDTTLTATGETVGAALTECGQRHRMLVQRVLTRGGVLRPHVNLFLNDSDVRAVGGLDATLQDGDTLTVVPSVSGG